MMMKSISLTQVEYLMLEEIAKKSRMKPLDFLRAWIRTEHAKIKS
jgi:hypothetical protein